jgi:hypothetical protein
MCLLKKPGIFKEALNRGLPEQNIEYDDELK